MSDKNDNDLLLKLVPMPYLQVIDEIVIKCKKKTSKISIIKILSENKYEKLVPYNLWFYDPMYKIVNFFENNQNIRARYYNTTLLTPLLTSDVNIFERIKSLLPCLSLYQPFYPENFYQVWEFLQKKYLRTDIRNFLHIGGENRLGAIEAIVFYHEKYQQTYQYNIYHVWLTGNEKYNKKTGEYLLQKPKNNYLGQAYNINFLKTTCDLAKYDFISIDNFHVFQNIFDWTNEEMDLHALLFYFLTVVHHIKPNGSMLIKLNMICRKSWFAVFDIVQRFFKEYIFIRPDVTNPFNSEIYLFLNKFHSGSTTESIEYGIFKNLYISKTYETFYINIKFNNNNNNNIYQKYLSAIKKWVTKLELILDSIDTKKTLDNSVIDGWHKSNDLKQISDMNSDFENKAITYVLKTLASNFSLKPIKPDILYQLPFYRKLIEKRADLNYYKRVMDTKPSRIFCDKRYGNNNNYLLTWEQISDLIDFHRGLKNTLRFQYKCEMVTNAWLKMYEMLNMFPEIIPNNKNIKSFHLCEAPGAFVAALNQYLFSKKQELEWYAQTLKPSNESDALDDHFGLIKKYPNKWLYGDTKNDATGDITHSSVIKWYAKHSLLKDIDIMTADAGLKCNPVELNEQEAFLGKINMGQIVCILACLSKGKSAIFKTFMPMSEPLTISMMYIVTHLFENVLFVKPSTSHNSNSEIYVVLKNYKGINDNVLSILYVLLDDPNITSKSLLFSKIDMPFFRSYMEGAGLFIDRQIKSLSMGYYYYYHPDQINSFQNNIEKCTNEWLNKNPVFVLQRPLLTQ